MSLSRQIREGAMLSLARRLDLTLDSCGQMGELLREVAGLRGRQLCALQLPN